MKLKNFDQYYSEMSDSTLVENLYKRNGFQSFAKEAMIKEAIKRQIIFSESDDEISETLLLYQTIQTPKGDFIPPTESFLVSYSIFYGLSILFCIGGIISLYMFFTYSTHLLISGIFFCLTFVFYRLTKEDNVKYKLDEKQFNRAGSPIWIFIGYFTSITGLFLIGLTISLEYFYSCKREEGKIVSYKYDNNTRKHGRIMLVINSIIMVVAFGYWILWSIGNNLK